MQTCKKILSAAVFGILIQAAFSQPVPPTPPKGPNGTGTMEIPGVKMPSMPQVSMPTMGSSFYTPGTSNSSNQKQNNQQTQQQTNQSQPAQQNPANPAPNIALAENNLSAADIQALAERGLFTNVSSIFGNSSNGINSVLGQQQNTNQTALLAQILSELNSIKNQQTNLNANNSVKLKPSNEPPALLRFVINTQDFLSSCSAVYISKPESDGTFLLTGDCRTLFNGRTQSETFYIFFKANGTKEGRTVYNVTSTLSQNYTNPYTLLYRLCSIQNVTATKTGNMVSFMLNQDGIRSDVLIDIGK